MNTKWLRTCQECGEQQICPPPPDPPTNAFRNRKCRKCKSSGLDYGQYKEILKTSGNMLVIQDINEEE